PKRQLNSCMPSGIRARPLSQREGGPKRAERYCVEPCTERARRRLAGQGRGAHLWITGDHRDDRRRMLSRRRVVALPAAGAARRDHEDVVGPTSRLSPSAGASTRPPHSPATCSTRRSTDFMPTSLRNTSWIGTI